MPHYSTTRHYPLLLMLLCGVNHVVCLEESVLSRRHQALMELRTDEPGDEQQSREQQGTTTTAATVSTVAPVTTTSTQAAPTTVRPIPPFLLTAAPSRHEFDDRPDQTKPVGPVKLTSVSASVAFTKPDGNRLLIRASGPTGPGGIAPQLVTVAAVQTDNVLPPNAGQPPGIRPFHVLESHAEREAFKREMQRRRLNWRRIQFFTTQHIAAVRRARRSSRPDSG